MQSQVPEILIALLCVLEICTDGRVGVACRESHTLINCIPVFSW